MILNKLKPVFLCILLCISGITALARVDNWSQKRPNNTVVQNQWGQAGYRPAVGYQQPLPQGQWNNVNHHQQLQHNNRTQYNYQSTASPQANRNPWIRNNQTQYQPQPPSYGQGSYNQSRPGWGSPQKPNQNPQYQPQPPSYVQGSYNQSRPGYGAPQQPNQNPWMRNNQTQYQPQAPQTTVRPGWPVSQQPPYSQGSYNQSRPGWGQPTNSNIYPPIPNNPNNRPVLPSNSWTPPANQTLIYPQIPNNPLPVQPNVGSNGIPLAPLAPLQPQTPQGPHNWHSGGQAALSYGPGHYAQPSANSNNNPPNRQGSSNPYANMFN